jgi:hypothetical protein
MPNSDDYCLQMRVNEGPRTAYWRGMLARGCGEFKVVFQQKVAKQ